MKKKSLIVLGLTALGAWLLWKHNQKEQAAAMQAAAMQAAAMQAAAAQAATPGRITMDQLIRGF